MYVSVSQSRRYHGVAEVHNFAVGVLTPQPIDRTHTLYKPMLYEQRVRARRPIRERVNCTSRENPHLQFGLSAS
jgi:hypothetical protein